MIDLKRSHLRLLVNDLRECFLFYKDVLELPVRYGNENEHYAEFKTDAIHIALYKKDLMAEVLKSDNKTSNKDTQDFIAMILRVDDVDSVYNMLVKKGVVFDTEPEDRPEWNCRTAHFRDPDGNLLELNSDL